MNLQSLFTKDLATSLQALTRIWTGGQKLTLDDLSRLQELAAKFSEILRTLLPIGPELVQSLTYGEAVRYFAEQRPVDSQVVRGAMLMQPHPQGFLFTQVFLTAENELAGDADGKPYGRRLIVKAVDEELRETFGGNDVVIVE